MRSVRLTHQLNRYSTWNRKKTTLFSRHYLHNRSTLDIGVLGHIGALKRKEHSPEVWHIPPGTSCINGWLKDLRIQNCLLTSSPAFER